METLNLQNTENYGLSELENIERSLIDSAPESLPKSTSTIWQSFDSEVVRIDSTACIKTAAIIELRQYCNDSYILRSEDPLKWWASREKVCFFSI